MRKNVLKQLKEEKTSWYWKESKKRSSLINKIPVFTATDDEDYFFEVEDF